jgi:hypothetical protein
MYYQYILLVPITIILWLTYKKTKHLLPNTVTSNIGFISGFLIVVFVYLIGLPTKLTSTLVTGKVHFTSSPHIPERVAADPETEAADLQKQKEILQKIKKDIEDEIE